MIQLDLSVWGKLLIKIDLYRDTMVSKLNETIISVSESNIWNGVQWVYFTIT